MKLKIKIPFIGKKDQGDTKTRVSKPEVHIRVLRKMGEMPVEIAEFDALQVKDDDYNLKLTNSDYDFKEDVTISNHKIVDLLKYRLDLASINEENAEKTKAKRIVKILEKIKGQETTLRDIKEGNHTNDDDEKSAKNIIDEEFKLEQLKVLKEVVENEGSGSYEALNIIGQREMIFELDNGVLYPYRYNTSTHTLYKDVGSKRKIYKERQDMIDQEYMDENRNPFSGIFKNILTIIFVALFLFNMYWNMELNKDRAEFTAMVDGSAFGEILDMAGGSYVKCADVLAKQTEYNEQFINLGKKELLESQKDEDTIDLQ